MINQVHLRQKVVICNYYVFNCSRHALQWWRQHNCLCIRCISNRCNLNRNCYRLFICQPRLGLVLQDIYNFFPHARTRLMVHHCKCKSASWSMRALSAGAPGLQYNCKQLDKNCCHRCFCGHGPSAVFEMCVSLNHIETEALPASNLTTLVLVRIVPSACPTIKNRVSRFFVGIPSDEDVEYCNTYFYKTCHLQYLTTSGTWRSQMTTSQLLWNKLLAHWEKFDVLNREYIAGSWTHPRKNGTQRLPMAKRLKLNPRSRTLHLLQSRPLVIWSNS